MANWKEVSKTSWMIHILVRTCSWACMQPSFAVILPYTHGMKRKRLLVYLQKLQLCPAEQHYSDKVMHQFSSENNLLICSSAANPTTIRT